MCRRSHALGLFPVLLILIVLAVSLQAQPSSCGTGRVRAEVVALDQPFVLNRLGAMVPQGMVFALKRDVVPSDCYANGANCMAAGATPTLQPGKVMLRHGKRPRPMVLRVNAGQCLDLTLWNMLPSPQPGALPGVKPPGGTPPFPATTSVSIHVNGLEVTEGIRDDGSNVGRNLSSLAASGQSIIYRILASRPGVFYLTSMGANFNKNGGSAQMGQATNGLFGSVVVEPEGAESYRSQVTNEDLLKYASRRDSTGRPMFTPAGQPLIDYEARYPANHPVFPCVPVLRMIAELQAPRGGTCQTIPHPSGAKSLYYTDLTAIITGPKQGRFSGNGPEFDPISSAPDRRQPYREFVIHYHELLAPVQAFPIFTDPAMQGVLRAGGDLFGINYGTGGLGAEILANRFGVGPVKDCVDCKFEEFFLSSWALGDPASVADVPANAEPQMQPSKVLYPDDPSNVYHSYVNEHLKFRIVHGGAHTTHVHHQHAHQWLHTPNENDSTYLDSQLISPGAAFTLEISHNGSGNRNKTIGDALFHCHFYPHFALGMWALWRVHDVFEAGTELDSDGVPKANARALPDGELKHGTPIPAIVPLPTLPMAPLPGYTHLDDSGRIAQFGGICDNNRIDGMPVIGGCANGTLLNGTANLDGTFVKSDSLQNPGYPFFIPGIAGARAPHPPLDFACDTDSAGNCKVGADGQPILLDGGLPRHIVLGGTVTNERHNQWDFSKDNDTLQTRELPEDGTLAEKAAMAFHGIRNHPSFTPSGTPGSFVTNGLPRGPQRGAPIADPAVDDHGNPAGSRVVRYKGANIQTDVVFNKKGWHYPQQRFMTLWQDVAPTLSGGALAEPFFFRANSKQDIIEFWQTNLVPSYYELDDYQVRTPTDILGQHIHLVKFDVLASDGAANGFNYEDGTSAYDEVTERINAINSVGGMWDSEMKQRRTLTPRSIPEIDPTGTRWPGAQATVQRWYPDPLLGDGGDPLKDRTLRTVFTHDHFGPSTHQQAGLYAGLLVEPENSTWTLQDGTPMGTRSDGGPTSWEARILAGNESYREFALEFQDLALAYTSSSVAKPVCYPGYPGAPGADCTPYDGPYPTTISATTAPWGWVSPGQAINPTDSGLGLKTNPTIITGTVFTGTMSVNYRNEPLAYRVNDPQDPQGKKHDVSKRETDLAFAYASIPRLDAQLNVQPAGPIAPASPFVYPKAFAGAGPYDPYTPLLRAYQNDRVQLRVLVGGYLFNHNFGIHGLKWLFEPSANDSGYRDNQGMGISEHFEFLFRMPLTANAKSTQPCAPGGPSSLFCADYLYMPGSGQWDQSQGLWGLIRSYNTGGGAALADLAVLPNNSAGGGPARASTCPSTAPRRHYSVKAVNAPPLKYNDRIPGTVIENPAPLRFVLTREDGDTPLVSNEIPLVLRANAGECVLLTLYNDFSPKNAVFTDQDDNANLGDPFAPVSGSFPNVSGYFPSTQAGVHPQLLAADVTRDLGMNVGLNPIQTVPPVAEGQPSQKRTYEWYAGSLESYRNGPQTPEAIELGAANLISADPIEHPALSMIGAMVVEPKGSTWPENGELTADVKGANGETLFREFVLILQNNVYLTQSVFSAMNYASESMAYRFGTPPTNALDLSNAYSNSLPLPKTTNAWGDPRPIFVAERGQKVRFRMLHPDGVGAFPDDVIKIHGHVWDEQPYTANSTVIGTNRRSESMGARDGFGSGNHFDILLESAGGKHRIPGDYLIASMPGAEQSGGNWALFRVCDPGNPLFPCTTPHARDLVHQPGKPIIAARRAAKPPHLEGVEPPTEAEDHSRFTLRQKP